jgi:hypothetical protein
MLHLAAYLEARSGFAETAIDSCLDQSEAAPSLGPNTLDASEHELLRDETYSNSPNLGAEAESFAGSPEKPSPAITDDNQDRSVRDEPLPTTTLDPDPLIDQQTPQFEPRGDSYVRGANDNVDDVGLIHQITSPALSTASNVGAANFLEDSSLPGALYEQRRPSAAHEDWSVDNHQAKQAASEPDPADLDLDRARAVVESELAVWRKSHDSLSGG